MSNLERIDLDTFLARLDEAEAGEARVAAARIDELAREGEAFEGIERHFAPWAIAGAVLFVLGVVLFLMPTIAHELLVVLCLAALPGVAIAYAFRVLARTRADAAAEDLNRRHFLPKGGLYFPPGERPSCVVLVDPQVPTDRSSPLPPRRAYW